MRNLNILSIALVMLSSCASQPEVTDQPRPNIIYILADDLGYGDLSCYGQTKFQTPNIDRLTQQGMLFTQHYAGSTVCAPSRSSLLTGLHTGHTPIRGNKEVYPEGQYPLADSVKTVAEVLQENNYITGLFGKWGLGYPGSEGDPLNQGFDTFYGYNCQRLAHNYYSEYLWDDTDKVELKGNDENGYDDYAPELIQKAVLTFLEENRDSTFFLYYANTLPHAELLVPERELGVFRGKYDPEKSYNGTDFGDSLFRKGKYTSQPESHAAFAAMVSILDRQVGEVMDKLEELGISQNTLVIFTSDNGPHLEGGADPDYFDSNGPLRGFKRDMYEGGIRVPFIARWPGSIQAASKTEHISAFWDFYPTVLDLVGVESPGRTDGISYLPVLLDQEGQRQHEYLYWEFNGIDPSVQALRSGDWKAVRFYEEPVELYHLIDDPAEQIDLSKDYPEKVEELLNLMEKAHVENPQFKLKRDDV